MASLLPTAWQASASATALIECICCLLCVARMAKFMLRLMQWLFLACGEHDAGPCANELPSTTD
jgi:hypothetical protein